MTEKQLMELGVYVTNYILCEAQVDNEPQEIECADGKKHYIHNVTAENVDADWVYDFVSALLLSASDVNYDEPTVAS